MKGLTKTQAAMALQTQYAKNCLDGHTVEQLQDENNFKTDGSAFYAIDESNYKEWLFCDHFAIPKKGELK